MGHYENLRDILYMHINAFIVVALLNPCLERKEKRTIKEPEMISQLAPPTWGKNRLMHTKRMHTKIKHKTNHFIIFSFFPFRKRTLHT